MFVCIQCYHEVLRDIEDLRFGLPEPLDFALWEPPEVQTTDSE